MRIDLGIILAMILGYIYFIYYADTLFYRKRNKYVCYTIIAVGYAVNLVSCMFGNVVINIIIMCIANCTGFYLCYSINYKSAVFQGIMLSALCIASEFLVAFIPYLNIISNDIGSSITPIQSFVLTLASRILYLAGVMIASRIFYNSNKRIPVSPSIGFVLIPILTVVLLIFLIKTRITSCLLSMVCLGLIVINLIVFAINQKTIQKEVEIFKLREQMLQENIDVEEYMILKEKYRGMSIFHHDLKEHMNTMRSLIETDPEKTKQYIRSLYNEEKALQFVEYSRNKILNIILTKKKSECEKQGIEFCIEPIHTYLEFLKDMDVVTIFSNLINNAIESCNRSAEKKIFMNVSTANENFIVIKIQNTADKKPVVIDGQLKTYKNNARLHGIGMNSIRRAIKNYDGTLDWEYDEEEKVFCTTVVIKKHCRSGKYLTV